MIAIPLSAVSDSILPFSDRFFIRIAFEADHFSSTVRTSGGQAARMSQG